MSKIILGIHGLGNKPPARLLGRWWKAALKEGLRANGHPRRLFKFKLVHWAHFLYPKPLDHNVRDRKHPLYIDNPYIPAGIAIKQRPNKLRKKVLAYIQRQLAKIILNDDFSINYASVSDLIIRRYFSDLGIYYAKTCLDRKKATRPAKDVLREELARMLRKCKRKDILLIGHSMGSIIAYDVLTSAVPDINIHTLVTVGSPLGLPPVMLKILAEQNKKPKKHITLRTPENIIKAWHNFADPADKIAVNYKLSDDYDKNSKNVRAIDAIIYNNYEYQGERNPHSIYGYLRTPEFAHVIYNFLSEGRPKSLIRLSDNINQLLDKMRWKKL